MNAARRQEINKIYSQTQLIYNKIKIIYDEESECRDNIPDNLQGTMMYMDMDQACDNLEIALTEIEDVLNALEEASL